MDVVYTGRITKHISLLTVKHTQFKVVSHNMCIIAAWTFLYNEPQTCSQTSVVPTNSGSRWGSNGDGDLNVTEFESSFWVSEEIKLIQQPTTQGDSHFSSVAKLHPYIPVQFGPPQYEQLCAVLLHCCFLLAVRLTWVSSVEVYSNFSHIRTR
jgi:hypothetical protein